MVPWAVLAARFHVCPEQLYRVKLLMLCVINSMVWWHHAVSECFHRLCLEEFGQGIACLSNFPKA